MLYSLLHQFAAEIPSLTDVGINKELFETAACRKGTLSQTRGEGGVNGTYKEDPSFYKTENDAFFSCLTFSVQS